MTAGLRAALALACALSASAAAPDEFAQSIRPVLAENCAPCHQKNFLKAQTAKDMESNRSLWRNVAAQLRNRTMPPAASKLTEEDRLRVAVWVDKELTRTACQIGDYAGAAGIRRLNRREYHNTVRDILGIDFDVALIFPADGSGGSGFDTNGETLYTPPVLMERYMEAAQQILDRVIVSTPLSRTFSEKHSLPKGGEFTVTFPVYQTGDYDVRTLMERNDTEARPSVKVDGVATGKLGGKPAATGRPLILRHTVHLSRGEHSLTVVAADMPSDIANLTIDQRPEPASPEKRALHYRLLGIEPGEEPVRPRESAIRTLASFLPKAFRRPVEQSDIDTFLKLYDRAAERGDPYTERMKLALRGVLVHPDFLFRIERRDTTPGIHPVGQYELAARLSYFLWSTVPDEELTRLAAQGRLTDRAVLAAQVDRMLDDPRSRAFADTFVGQWLGTQDLGGRAAPLLTELQGYYSPEVAADLRTEPILLFHHLVSENKSLLDLLNADYSFLNERLVRYYQLEDKLPDVHGPAFRLVKWPDNRRAGVVGMASVLALTSHYSQTSPVLRGAWALETLLGTPVPPPPPNVPPLDNDRKLRELTVRQKLERHRADPTCSACHKLMDPIGFALENFDWMGRWRDKESNGQPLDISGTLPTGETFSGPVELRQALLGRKDDFLRHLTAKTLGYALGRSLQDGDSCTVQHLADALKRDNYRARTLISEVVLSVPFRNTQGGIVQNDPAPPPPPKRVKPMVTK
jgi:hypothetical protein